MEAQFGVKMDQGLLPSSHGKTVNSWADGRC